MSHLFILGGESIRLEQHVAVRARVGTAWIRGANEEGACTTSEAFMFLMLMLQERGGGCHNYCYGF